MNKDLIAFLREEIRQVRQQLNEDTVEPSPGGHWTMELPPEEAEATAEEPPISPEETGLSAVEDRAYELIQMMQEMAQESPEEAQEALGALTAVLEDAGMLDAMCATTQGTIGFHREGLVDEIKNIIVEITDDPQFGFGPENEPKIDWPKRHLDVEAEAGVNEAMDNAVHRAKMSGISKEDLAELFASAVHASYEESA